MISLKISFLLDKEIEYISLLGESTNIILKITESWT